METRRGTRHCNSVTKTIPQPIETEFCHAISTTILLHPGHKGSNTKHVPHNSWAKQRKSPKVRPLGIRLNQHLHEKRPRITPTRTHTSHFQPFQILDMRLSDLLSKRQYITLHCHSCSDLHLNTENGKTVDVGRNHDYDQTSNRGHISHTNQNVRKRIAHTTSCLILCNRSRPNRLLAQHAIFSNQTSPLQNIQYCRSCVAQMESSSCLQTAIAHAFALSWAPLSSKQHRTIGTATTNQPFDIIKNDVS